MGSGFSYKKQILEHHIDTFGHVNNAMYLVLFEEARWQFITDGGYGMERIKETKVGPILVDLRLRFRKEITNREWITIESHCGEIKKGLFMPIVQKIIKENAKVAATLDLTVAMFDLEKRVMTRPTTAWLNAIGLPS